MDLTNQIENLPLGFILDIPKEELINLASDVPEAFIISYGKNALREYIITHIIYRDNDDPPEYEISFT